MSLTDARRFCRDLLTLLLVTVCLPLLVLVSLFSKSVHEQFADRLYTALKDTPLEREDYVHSVHRSHRSLEDRMAAAQRLLSMQPACPLLVDNMQNSANAVYGATPERLYIVLNGRVVYEGGEGPHDYKLEEVEHWLAAYKQTKEQMS